MSSKKQAKKMGMTVEEFKKGHDGAPYDTQELAEVASTVQGEVGEKARALLKVLGEFDAALEAIDFEVG